MNISPEHMENTYISATNASYVLSRGSKQHISGIIMGSGVHMNGCSADRREGGRKGRMRADERRSKSRWKMSDWLQTGISSLEKRIDVIKADWITCGSAVICLSGEARERVRTL